MNGISGQIFGLILSFLCNRYLHVVLEGKSSQEYPVIAGVPKGSILGLHSSSYINDFLDDVMQMILLSTLSMIRNLICGNN